MRLLQQMSDGGFHSGESLGAAMGVSRAAVWKQIRRWQQKGLHIDSVPGKGYRWVRPIEWWSEEALRAHIPADINQFIPSIQIMPTVGSTNAAAMEYLLQSPVKGAVFIAEEQSEGRGRRGRQWLAPLGMGLYASVTWVFDDGLGALEGLSLAVGLAVADALHLYGVQGIGLKWPNDIMYGDAKLGGVLIEMQMDGDGRCLVVIGVGINLAVAEGMSDALGRQVAGVSDIVGVVVQRNMLGAMVLARIVHLLAGYGQGVFALLKDRWSERDVLRGRHVALDGMGSVVEGVACGVDLVGALLVETGGGIVRVSSGEVSLRRA